MNIPQKLPIPRDEEKKQAGSHDMLTDAESRQLGAGGARNAGILAVQILALKSDKLRHRLLEYKDEMAKGVESKAERLSEVGYREYAKS